MIRLVTTSRGQQKKDCGADHKTEQDPPITLARYVNGEPRWGPARKSAARPATLNEPAPEPQTSAQQEKHRGDKIRQNANIGISARRKEVQRKQKEKREQTSQRDDGSCQTQPVPKIMRMFGRLRRFVCHKSHVGYFTLALAQRELVCAWARPTLLSVVSTRPNSPPALKQKRLCGSSTLLVKGANVSDQRLDLVVTQFVPVGVHFLFALFDDPFLDDLDGVFVLRFGLDFRVSVIFDTTLPAHFGLDLAVCAVALLAMFFPVFLRLGRGDRRRCGDKQGQGQYVFLHSYVFDHWMLISTEL